MAEEARDVAAPEPSGWLFVGGRARARAPGESDAIRRCHEGLGRFLQIKNLSVLIGAGASVHLGSPTIRGLTAPQVIDFVEQDQPLDTEVRDLLEHLAATASDLEQLLSVVTSGLSFAKGTKAASLPVTGENFSIGALTELRNRLNRALGKACDLPSAALANAGDDPLLSHREFFRRLLRARRGDLPRVRVFTTNYDLLIEKALDESAVAYVDGFTGTVSRVFHPEVYEQDIYVPESQQSSRSTRLQDMLYLYKLHGSINWKSRPSPATLGSSVVIQRPDWTSDDDLLMIYPTPQKESDVLGYPYAELFKTFATTLATSETGLLVVGYGFSDDHLNRLIFQALAAIPTFQLFVVDPGAAKVLDGLSEPGQPPTYELADSMAGRLARWSDARISVLTGDWARFVNLAASMIPDPDETADPNQTLVRRMAELQRLIDGAVEE